MVSPQKRSRSVKKVKKKTPGGRKITHFKAGKHKKPSCGRCSKKLSLNASRKYGGALCTNCSSELIRYVTRLEAVQQNPELFKGVQIGRDLTIEKFLPKDWYNTLSKGKLKDVKAKTASKKKEKKPVAAEAKAKTKKSEKPSKAKKPAKKKPAKKKSPKK